MDRPNRRGWISALAILALAICVAMWAAFEANRQRRDTARILTAQAESLAHSLGTALAGATAAAREMDEQTGENLLAALELLSLSDTDDSVLTSAFARLQELGFDALVVAQADGSVRTRLGEEIPGAELQQALNAVASGADSVLLDIGDDEHLTAAVRTAGGLTLGRIHRGSARALTGQSRIELLLQRLVGSGDNALYLIYEEQPEAVTIEASWDGGPVGGMPGNDAVGTWVLRGRTVYEVQVPVRAPAGTVASLRVGLDARPLEAAAGSAMRRTLLVGILLAGLGLAAGAYAWLRSVRSRERVEADRRLADEVDARRRSERLAAAGALTAGLAHEVRSPLNAISLAAQRIARSTTTTPSSLELATQIRTQVVRLEQTLREFLDLARPAGESREWTDLAALAQEVLDLVHDEADESRIELRPVRGSASARVDGASIHRSILNLVHNAVEASSPGGVVEIECREQGERALIDVLDRGHGLDPDVSVRVFDAFVTTRSAGTGLGLSLVRRCAEEHGGTVQLAPRPGGGTCARLDLTRDTAGGGNRGDRDDDRRTAAGR